MWDLALFFLAAGTVYLFWAFIFKKRKSLKDQLIAERKDDLTPMISTFLFFNPDSPSVLHEEYIQMKVKIRQMLKDELNRKVMTEILMDLRKDLSGDAQEQVYDLYQDLGLHMDAFKKLQSWRWERVSKAIEELTEMRVTQAYPFIKKFVNDKRSVIRKKAQLASVTLRPEGITYFMDTARYRISEWQQLSLLDVLRHKEDFNPPKFKAWLISKNRDVVRLALRLIKYYNQTDAGEELIQLARHRSNRVKLEAIECIDKFHTIEALDTLKAVFYKGNNDVKIAILDTIAHMGSEADLDFLDRVARKDPNFIVRTKAESSMNAVSPGMVTPSENLEDIAIEIRQEAEETDAAAPDLSEVHGSFPDGNEAEENEVDPVEFPELAAILEEEDEAIFDQCFLEELQDILSEANGEEEEEAGFLPLDFLPVVLNEGEDKPNFYISEVPLWDLDVSAEWILDKETESSELSLPEPKIPEIDWDSRRLDFEELIDAGHFWEDTIQGFQGEEDIDSIEPEIPETEEDLIGEVGCMERDKPCTGNSVFAELFQKSDRQAKLMLLEEIRKIGEEKEVNFLRTLRDEDAAVVKLSREVLTELERKFSVSASGEEKTLEAIEEVREDSDREMEWLNFDWEFSGEQAEETVKKHTNTPEPLMKIIRGWQQLIRRN